MQNRVRASISGSLGVSHCKSGKWLLKTRVTGERRIASKLCDPDELAEAVEMYDLLSLHQHGEGALLNHPEKLSEYHEALADKSKLKSVTDLLAKSDRTYASEFVGVDIKTPGFLRGDMTKFWTSRVNYRDKKTKSKYLPLTRPNEGPIYIMRKTRSGGTTDRVQGPGGRLQVGQRGSRPTERHPGPPSVIEPHSRVTGGWAFSGFVEGVEARRDPVQIGRKVVRRDVILVIDNVSILRIRRRRLGGHDARKHLAARAYDLLCRLYYGDQFNGVEGVLNNPPNQARHVACEQIRRDGVEVWRVNATFVMIILRQRRLQNCRCPRQQSRCNPSSGTRS
ncbi:uncharacterized protein SRS1_21012 [Sporisorium reilianum f. sp. reilianum]|uniref:Uncharacterized protein n=1 Tax=Sporisorium reilianum f. sp. reilianum TaxID=72559 RepID=A0A2N8UJY1_9BASI|nr:uncharacterized protein SRS1_21012 [Sporisorium reilianum f. sp. reilianum]